MNLKLKNVLYITHCCPSTKEPSFCPFIGYRLAYLQNNGIHADVIMFLRFKAKNLKSFKAIMGYLFAFFFPIVIFEKSSFLDKNFKIIKIYYNFLSQFWLPIIVSVLSKLNNYSLLHYHFLWYTEELPLIKKVIHLPSIISVHGSDLHTTAVNDSTSYLKFKEAISYADRIIYVSGALREIAKSINIATKRDIVIPNGYDPKTFFPTSKSNSNLTLGFVGHLYEIKRADKLPEIFMHIKEKIPDAKLLIVGGGDKECRLENYIKEQLKNYGIINDVYFSGNVKPTEVARYYRMMDILLLPSRNEGFGCVAIEARACGVPVVGSSNGGIPESVGEGGVIVPEGENFETRFADSVVNFSKKLPSREDIAKRAFSFDWDFIIKQEIAVYNEVLNDKL
jgi:glycosyltransferase involved in cell wall biosynthesis